MAAVLKLNVNLTKRRFSLERVMVDFLTGDNSHAEAYWNQDEILLGEFYQTNWCLKSAAFSICGSFFESPLPPHPMGITDHPGGVHYPLRVSAYWFFKTALPSSCKFYIWILSSDFSCWSIVMCKCICLLVSLN